MGMFENVSSYQVRFSIGACCATGRNFLFAGYSNIIRPLCAAPPSSPPSAPPPSPTPSPPPPAPPPPFPPQTCEGLENRNELTGSGIEVRPFESLTPSECGCEVELSSFCLDPTDLNNLPHPPPSPLGRGSRCRWYSDCAAANEGRVTARTVSRG